MSESFNLKEIRALLDMLQKHEITEFKLERGGEKLWLKRGFGEPAPIQQIVGPYPPLAAQFPPMPSAPVETTRPLQKSQGGFEPAQSVAAESSGAMVETVSAVVTVESKNLHLVESPMVGTFYRRPAVDAEPYVEVGDLVKKGDVLCIVEAMKLMNEIESDVTGIIREICLEDGQMVEYGEPLFRIETT